MLTLSLIKERTNEVIRRLKVKQFNAEELVKDIIALDEDRRTTQNKLDSLQSELNIISKEIGGLLKSNRKEEAELKKAKTGHLKKQIEAYKTSLTAHEAALKDLLVKLPNLPDNRVPEGSGAEGNVIVREGGILPQLPADAMPHWDLAKVYDIIDFELGNKLTGAGFPVYKGQGSKLQRALINFFLDENIKAGYLEIMPPLMV